MWLLRLAIVVWVRLEVALAAPALYRTGRTGQLVGRVWGRLMVVLLTGGIALGFAAAAVWPAWRIQGYAAGLSGLGLVLMACGMAVMTWGVLTLGSYYRLAIEIDPDHRLVTKGPYRYVRHPIYAGRLLIALGIGVALDNWLSVVLCLLFPLAGVIPQIAREERALNRALGGEYAEYIRRTWRLLPGIW